MARKTPLKLINHVVLIVDESGSMSHLRNDVVDRFNEQLEEIRNKSAAEGQQTDVTIYTFNHYPTRLTYVTDVNMVRPFTLAGYSPNGQTALNDTIGNAIEDMAKIVERFQENVSFLFLIITDGAENNSRNYATSAIRQLIENRQRAGNYSFMFLCPPRSRDTIANMYGIPLGNIREWEATSKELERASVATTAALSSYFVGRSRGVRASSVLYETDLSKVAATAVQTQLVDVTPMFRKMTVDREASIQAFIEYKTNADYRMGDGFYELTKKEKIQPHKEILVFDRVDSKLYAGTAARDLLGLPKDVEFRVAPGNHANYKIFVQSKSPNRKLVRGTTLYYKKA